MQGIDMGNVPAWISAAGGVTATVAAVFAAVFTWKALNRERERDFERHEMESRAQAELVAAWVDADPQVEQSLVDGWAVFVRNRSELPIFDVAIEATVRPSYGTERWPITSRTWKQVGPRAEVFALAAGDSAAVQTPADNLLITLSFSDCGGFRWARDERGRLARTGTNEAGGADTRRQA